MKKIALSAQIAAIELLDRIMSGALTAKGLTGKEAEFMRPRLAAAIATLRWLEANRADVLALMSKGE